MIRRPPIPTLFPSPTLFRSLAAGAAAAFDPADPAARKAILASTGGVFAACDFVGSDRSLQFALGALAKGGKVVITGLIGRSEEHTSELQSRPHLVCRLLLVK